MYASSIPYRRDPDSPHVRGLLGILYNNNTKERPIPNYETIFKMSQGSSFLFFFFSFRSHTHPGVLFKETSQNFDTCIKQETRHGREGKGRAFLGRD